MLFETGQLRLLVNSYILTWCLLVPAWVRSQIS